MAEFSYNRSYKLSIETPPEIVKDSSPAPSNSVGASPPIEGMAGLGENDPSQSDRYIVDPLIDAGTIITDKDDYTSINPSKVTEITDLHIEADITFDEKSQGSDPIRGTIKIFNLSPETIANISSVNSIVNLEAGYGEDTKLIFTGEVLRSFTKKEGQNVITTLQCKDGGTQINGILYTRSFPRNQSYGQIFLDIVDQFNKNGIATGSVVLDQTVKKIGISPQDAISEQSWSFSGYLRKALDTLCKEFFYKWKIIHSRLYIYPEDYPEMVGKVTVNEDNIISLRSLQDGSTKVSTDSEGLGIELMLFLEGAIDGTKLLEIKEPTTKGSTIKPFVGVYRVSGYKHILEYEGNSWYTKVTCDKPREDI